MQSESDIAIPQLTLEKKQTSLKEDANTYFVEGFELPPEEQMIRNRLLAQIPIIKTKTYRESLLTIVNSLGELERFSQNLEGKVDGLLHAQETQFVDSYRGHIAKIRGEFQALHRHTQELQQKIRYYENQGKMSALVKKVFHLEQESARLYKSLADRDKRIKDLDLTVKVQENEMKRLQEAIKLNAREKSEILWKQQMQREQKNELSKVANLHTPVKLHEMAAFATEIVKRDSFSQNHQDSSVEDKGNTLKNFLLGNSLSQKSATFDLEQHSINNSGTSPKNKVSFLIQEQLSKENARLKVRNKKLLSLQARLISRDNQMEEFFIECVQQLKKEIKIRKKMDRCSLEEFKKQDKLLLLIKVLSNDQILTYLHERLFRKPSKGRNNQSTMEKEGNTDQSQIERSKKLPRINFNLNYQNK